MTGPEDDLDRIMHVMELAFAPEYGEAWTRRQVSDALLLPNTRYGLISSNGDAIVSDADQTAGFFLSRSILDEEELLLFAIAPSFRRRGLGHTLLTRFIEQARSHGMTRLFLEMRSENPAGILYASHGFRQVGVRPGYYRTTDGLRIDAVSQALDL
ncbi:GNAT family N-acetyltransferase [Novosphingobium sp. KCTC 2891]|uniref:GNAT family N-acetyltransferase n=1 Tax=Novosphingobium sp. KCTC 2891 TaxID=2989730 RepID=UPI0022232FAB|nr:GNAT family N-acetyltransferase [Novosphingobium sp. KCTC 2891]MCW1382627.1 GNAT family N-acetyltransferase [Novosphingobium sp. KCTC 2891]